MVQHILNDVDPGVLKTTLVNFFIYGNDASPSRQPPQPRRSKERAQKAPSPDWETVLLHARRCYDPLPAACAGAVTSVRVTPLEKVRLLRMAEKSLDMLR